MTFNRRTAVRRILVLLFTAPLLAVGLSTAAHASVDEPDPIDPPPPCMQRDDFTHAFNKEMTPPMVNRRGSGGSYLVVFTLQPQHAFNPPDPNGCTGTDRIVSKLGIPSANIVSAPTILQDQQTVVKQLTPANLGDPMVYHFKVLFQRDFNVTGQLNPKRDARWCLNLRVMNVGDPPEPAVLFQCQS